MNRLIATAFVLGTLVSGANALPLAPPLRRRPTAT